MHALLPKSENRNTLVNQICFFSHSEHRRRFPVHICAVLGLQNTLQVMNEFGADLETQSKRREDEGATALILSAKYRQTGTLKIFLGLNAYFTIYH